MRRAMASLVLALMLIAPPSAAAECAWVLWQRLEDPVQNRIGPTAYKWTFLSASPREQQCAELRSAAYREMEERLKRDRKSVTLGEAFGLVQYFCVPDTIDPRGPKGK